MEEKQKNSSSYLECMTANERMEMAKGQPMPLSLFDGFWVRGELTILFANTGIGKTILAVQIADSIAKGEPIEGFDMEVEAQPVLYADFELTDKQFEMRYAEQLGEGKNKQLVNHYQFHDNFTILRPNKDRLAEEGVDGGLISALEEKVVETGAKVLVVDNISYIKDSQEKTNEALTLMKRLNMLKMKHGLSILVLGHTPKRDKERGLTDDDLAGSKMLGNFTDAMFAIGKNSEDGSGRVYLKQVLVRSAEHKYSADNVIVCSIEKTNNFIKFVKEDMATESSILKMVTDEEQRLIEERVVMLHEEHNMSLRKIAADVGWNKNKVQRFLQRRAA